MNEGIDQSFYCGKLSLLDDENASAELHASLFVMKCTGPNEVAVMISARQRAEI